MSDKLIKQENMEKFLSDLDYDTEKIKSIAINDMYCKVLDQAIYHKLTIRIKSHNDLLKEEL